MPVSQLTVGSTLTIYEDPLTERIVEGTATLLVYKYSGGSYNGRNIEWWIVKFTDGTKGLRKILVPDPNSIQGPGGSIGLKDEDD